MLSLEILSSQIQQQSRYRAERVIHLDITRLRNGYPTLHLVAENHLATVLQVNDVLPSWASTQSCFQRIGLASGLGIGTDPGRARTVESCRTVLSDDLNIQQLGVDDSFLAKVQIESEEGQGHQGRSKCHEDEVKYELVKRDRLRFHLAKKGIMYLLNTIKLDSLQPDRLGLTP